MSGSELDPSYSEMIEKHEQEEIGDFADPAEFEDNVPQEPVRDEEYFEQGHSSPHNPPNPEQQKANSLSEDALDELARILGTNKDGERVLSDKAAQIWDLLYPYIASEDPPDLGIDAEAELLTADYLPKVWDLVLAMEDE